MESPFIDIVVALSFLYTLLSMVVSAVQEWIAGLVGLRAGNLRSGLNFLLGSSLASRLYNNSPIKSLYRPRKFWKNNSGPSYIEPSMFSRSLVGQLGQAYLDGTITKNFTAQDIKAIAAKIDPDSPLKPIVNQMVDDGVSSASEMERALAQWFDQSMDRISGWYARAVKWRMLLIALAIAVALNADTVHIARALWQNHALTKILADSGATFSQDQMILGLIAETRAPGSAVQNLDALAKEHQNQADVLGRELQRFPIGWQTRDWLDVTCSLPFTRDDVKIAGEETRRQTFEECFQQGLLKDKTANGQGNDKLEAAIVVQESRNLLERMLGWLVTAAAISLGAPFWFDVLSKVAKLRSAGSNPTDPSVAQGKQKAQEAQTAQGVAQAKMIANAQPSQTGTGPQPSPQPSPMTPPPSGATPPPPSGTAS